MTRRWLVALVVTTCVALPVTACGDAGSDGVSPSPTATGTTTPGTTSTPSPSLTASSAPTLSGASLAPVVKAPTSARASLLIAARLASRPGYDRFVLEFRGAVPGFAVRYVKAPIKADPSDALVAVKGSAFLSIRLEPASGVDLRSSSAIRTYTGPTRLAGGSPPVREAVLTGDFESVMNWVLGVDGKQPFRVLTLTSPSRVVVDVASN